MEYTVRRHVEYEPLGTYTTYSAINKRGKVVYSFERDDIGSIKPDIKFLKKRLTEVRTDWQKTAIQAVLKDMQEDVKHRFS